MKKFLLTLEIVFVSLYFPLKAQNKEMGIIEGKIFDATTNGSIGFASVTIEQLGVPKGFGQSDDSGHYVIRPIVAGIYDIKIDYPGYQSITIKNVIVESDTTSVLNVGINQSNGTLEQIIIVSDKFIRIVELA